MCGASGFLTFVWMLRTQQSTMCWHRQGAPCVCQHVALQLTSVVDTAREFRVTSYFSGNVSFKSCSSLCCWCMVYAHQTYPMSLMYYIQYITTLSIAVHLPLVLQFLYYSCRYYYFLPPSLVEQPRPSGVVAARVPSEALYGNHSPSTNPPALMIW